MWDKFVGVFKVSIIKAWVSRHCFSKCFCCWVVKQDACIQISAVPHSIHQLAALLLTSSHFGQIFPMTFPGFSPGSLILSLCLRWSLKPATLSSQTLLSIVGTWFEFVTVASSTKPFFKAVGEPMSNPFSPFVTSDDLLPSLESFLYLGVPDSLINSVSSTRILSLPLLGLSFLSCFLWPFCGCLPCKLCSLTRGSCFLTTLR